MLTAVGLTALLYTNYNQNNKTKKKKGG